MQLLAFSAVLAVATAAYGPPAVERASVPDYSYGTAVSDPVSGVHNTKEETRLGDRTEGSYSTLLPDGRRQIVTYWVDGNSGYNAKVTYEGVAHHPEPAVVKASPAPPSVVIGRQYDTPAVRGLTNVLLPPSREVFIQTPEAAFLPDPVDFQREVVRSVPVVDTPHVADVRAINQQRALNNFDFNNRGHLIANNINARQNYAGDYLYGQVGVGAPGFGVRNVGQRGQLFGGLQGAAVRTPVFAGHRQGNLAGFPASRGVGLNNRFIQQAHLQQAAVRRPFVSANGFRSVGNINGLHNANNFRRDIFNAQRQNYDYQGYQL